MPLHIVRSGFHYPVDPNFPVVRSDSPRAVEAAVAAAMADLDGELERALDELVAAKATTKRSARVVRGNHGFTPDGAVVAQGHIAYGDDAADYA